MTIHQAITRYNIHAAWFGWLPYRLTIESHPVLLRDAANKCVKLYPEIATPIYAYLKEQTYAPTNQT